MKRRFEVVRKECKKNITFEDHLIPQRMTNKSAGYDFFLNNNGVTIFPNQVAYIWTDIKAKMGEDEVLFIFIRSSLAIKKELRLVNHVGIIDSDYYSNPDNDGNICFCIRNDSKEVVNLKKHDRIGQGIFVKYLKTDNDEEYTKREREGGIGSTK